METCSVCLNGFTNVLRQKIECPFCKVAVCFTCYQTNVLLQASNPCCVNCKRAITEETLDGIFSKNFRRGTLRKQRIKNLAEQEKSLLPATALYIDNQKNLSSLDVLRNQLNVVLNTIQDLTPLSQNTIERIISLQNQIRTVRQKIDAYNAEHEGPKEAKKERVVRSIKCPNDTCKSFICISSTDTCSICKTKVCRKCRTIDLGNHTCDEATLATLQEIMKNTKCCPKCGTGIERISGCNQMFCTYCNTAFDWATCTIVNGPIHNPHYFQYLSENANVANEVRNLECNELHMILNNHETNEIRRRLCNCMSFDKEPCKSPRCSVKCGFFKIIMASNWIFDWSTRPISEYTALSYRDLRIRLLKNEITEAEFLSKVSTRETLRLKQTKIRDIHRMYCAVARDLALDLLNHSRDMDKFTWSMSNLRIYTYNAKKRILQDFSDKTFQHFNDSWQLEYFNVD